MKPYTSVYIDGVLVAVTQDDFDQRILQVLGQRVGLTSSTKTVASQATGGHVTTHRYVHDARSQEAQSNYGRVRRRLQALYGAGKVRRRKNYHRQWEWFTNDPDLLAAEARKKDEKAAQAAEVKRIAMGLGFLLDEGPLPGDDEEVRGKNPDDRKDANERKLHFGYSVELTNEEFLTLAAKAGLTTETSS